MTDSVTEGPSWLLPMVKARVNFMLAEMGGALPDGYPIILTTLTEPVEGTSQADRERWERTCDHCGRFCGDGEDFYTGSMGLEAMTGTRVQRVEVTFGMCPECADA